VSESDNAVFVQILRSLIVLHTSTNCHENLKLHKQLKQEHDTLLTVLLVQLYLELVRDLVLHGVVESCDRLGTGLIAVHSAAHGRLLHQLRPLKRGQLTQSFIAVDHREVDDPRVRKQEVAICNVINNGQLISSDLQRLPN